MKTLLDAPEGVRAEAAIDSILISFEAAAGATGYDINFNGEVYCIAGTSRAFTGLISDEAYTYAVRSVNGTVTSEYTKEAAVRTLPDLPEVPDPNAVSTLDEVEISWEPVAKATTGYDIKFDGKVYTVNREGKLFFEPGTDARKATELSKTFTGLEPGKSYSYSMRARNGRFLSAYSPTKHISTKKRRPGGLPNESPKKHYPDGKIPYMGLDPVNALTGDFLWSYTCLEDYGKERLHFTVMYDSHRHPYFKTLGIKWTYSLNYRLHIDSEFAYFGTPHEELIVFVADAENDSYTPLAKIHAGYTMEKNQDGSYRICAADGMEYMFDGRLCLTEIAENGLTV